MPRLSPYAIKLSSFEEVELHRRASKYTLPYFQVQRAKMILYAAQGMSNDEIASCLDTRREVVSLWRKRFFTDRLVDQIMTRPPYNDARRVFWIVDNCSAHRGVRAVERLRNRYSQLTLVHAPIHASWLNQIEIYFSIVQRKVLTPNDFPDLNSVAERLLNFQYYWEDKAKPFEWKFTRTNLAELLGKIGNPCCPQEPRKYVSELLN